MLHILILGGTSEARDLTVQLVRQPDIAVTVSLAGRTDHPAEYPCPTVTGGFGGTEGLATWIADHQVSLVIDATHPFATTMHDNVEAACANAGIAAIRYQRDQWSQDPDDNWVFVDSHEDAIDAAGASPRRIFLSIGRQNACLWSRAPQHHYLIRSVEPVIGLEGLPQATFILDRGPFDLASERQLLLTHSIEVLVTKQSGGAATRAKLDAARELGLPVIMIRQPEPGTLPVVQTVDEVLEAIAKIRMSAAY